MVKQTMENKKIAIKANAGGDCKMDDMCMTGEQATNIYKELLETNRQLGDTNGKLATVTERLEHVPEQARAIAKEEVEKHIKNCSNKKRNSVSPSSKTIKLSPETRSLILKITVIAGVFASGMGGKEVIAMIFGG